MQKDGRKLAYPEWSSLTAVKSSPSTSLRVGSMLGSVPLISRRSELPPSPDGARHPAQSPALRRSSIAASSDPIPSGTRSRLPHRAIVDSIQPALFRWDMQTRKFGREFKVEALKLVKEPGGIGSAGRPRPGRS